MNNEANPEIPANVCPSCGQEQLGKANRCWKCGVVLIERKRYAPVHFPPYQAPQRLVPHEVVPGEIEYVDEVIVAEVVSAASAAETFPQPQPIQIVPSPVHRGSPFQKDDPFRPSQMATHSQFSQAAQYSESVWMPGMEHYSARGGAVAALVLGFITMIGGLLTGFALLNGMLGIALGIWGLNSAKKRMATVGILLCVLGMLLTLGLLVLKAASPTGSGIF